jgi:ribosomal protein L32
MKKLKECENCNKLILRGNLCTQCKAELQEARRRRMLEKSNRTYSTAYIGKNLYGRPDFQKV